MNAFGELIGYAVLAALTENLVFTGGIGSSRMLRAARNPKQMLSYSGLLCFFTLVTSLLCRGADKLLNQLPEASRFRPLGYALCAAALYIAVVLVLKKWCPEFYQKLEQVLPTASINCIVIALPFIANSSHMDFAHTVSFALGACAGFLLAVWLSAEGMRRINNDRMAKAFLGLPALFLYLGILSLAFLGFSNGGMFRY